MGEERREGEEEGRKREEKKGVLRGALFSKMEHVPPVPLPPSYAPDIYEYQRIEMKNDSDI
jgi:hypothetical protein